MLACFTVNPAVLRPQDRESETAASMPTATGSEAPPVYGPPSEDATVVRPATPIAIPQPLDLAAASAAQTHPAVDGAEAEAEALAAEYRGAKWRRFPSLSVEVLSSTRGSTIADQDGIALNAALEQPIWLGGRISSEIQRAKASLRAGEDRVELARRQIVLDVVQAYYQIVLADQRLAVLEDSLDQHNELLASIGRRVQQEVSPLADLTLGRSRTAQVELDIASTRENRDSAQLRLVELTGGMAIQPGLPLPSVADLLPPEDMAVAEAMGCDPSLAALTSLVAAAEADGDFARAQLLPQVLLQLSQNEITGSRAAIVLRMQLGNGGAQFSAIDSADARVRQALARYAEAERQVREDMRRDYVQVRSARARIATGELAADAADAIVASYQRQFIAGRRSWLDVMNAVREAAGARISEGDARVLIAQGTARILARTCRWQPVATEAGR